MSHDDPYVCEMHRSPHEKIGNRLMSSVATNRRTFLKFVAGSATSFLLPQALAPTAPAQAQASAAPSAISTVLHNADEAARFVLSLAQQAANNGTFGVGGAIVDNATGRVIHAMSNRVLQRLGAGLGALSNKSYTSDPTAHGERQLVFWYYENRKLLNLPEPKDLTIVTTLDPCAMCAGTLMTAGFNVAVVAFDDFAGVNWDKATTFDAYPPQIRQKLRGTFGYYATKDGRAYAGPRPLLFAETAVSKESEQGCEQVFTQGAEQARKDSGNSGRDPRDPANAMIDPAQLPRDSLLRKRIAAAFPDAFSIRLDDYRRPDRKLKTYLESLVAKSPGAQNAVAFVDYHGNLLMASADRFDIAPVATAFMNVVQDYSRLRFALVNDATTSADAQRVLSSPKYGTFVFLRAPEGASTNTLKDMGAYGSTMEGPVPVASPSNFQFYDDPATGTVEDLLALIRAMPPLYGPKLVNITPERARP